MVIQYSIKIDKDLKDKAMETANDLGVPLSVLTKAFFKHLVNSREITFSIEGNRDLDKVIDEALNSAKVKDSFKKLATYVIKHPVKSKK